MEEEIRSQHEKATVRNSWNRTLKDAGQSSTRHRLTDNGGIESYVQSEKTACHCGCIEEPGGFCSVCQELICAKCFTRCAGPKCLRPIGPCCMTIAEDEQHNEVPLCGDCYEQSTRKKLARSFFSLVLSPFIRFKH